LYITKK